MASPAPFGVETLERRLLLSSVLTSLASFSGADGQDPTSGVIVSNGIIYGTTSQGGANGDGEVYSVPVAGGTPTVLASFDGADGEDPEGVIVSGSTLYGATNQGGANGDGEIYSLPIGGGTPTILASFGGSAGSYPTGGVIEQGGALFGTTSSGGANDDGEVYELPSLAPGGTPEIVASFSSMTPVYPEGGLIWSNGYLYGTTAGGGDNDNGAVYSVSIGSGAPALTILGSFNFDGSNGEDPEAGLVLSGSTLYGTTENGGANDDGVIFSEPISGGTPTVVASLSSSTGDVPLGGLILVNGDTLYGTASQGGDLSLNNGTGDGTIFSLPLSGGTPNVEATFEGSNGEAPASPLATDDTGTLYGTTSAGGTDGDGTVFNVVSLATTGGPPLALTTPATSLSVDVGQNYTIDWTGGNSSDTVQLWAEGGPSNSWTELTSGVPETNGSYTWDTTGVDHGWYYFQAWDIPASGTPYAVQSPNYLHIVASGASAPNVSLSNPALSGGSVAQGTNYTLDFSAGDGSGDANPVYVQLWVYSGDTGQWSVLPNANYLPASQTSYVWDTTDVAPGWYSFAAHATNGDEWSYASSPGWVDVTVAAPTIAFTTPTSGQSAAAGGTFNLNWNITGISQTDLTNSTMQIWAQHVVDGSPVWTEVTAGADASSGTYAWTVPTTPGAGTYYAFTIWLNVGNDWWAQSSPNWLQVT
ncbi:MAG: choice-of-anchor tandem repeat GloVer-containing protein [Tepidisphaeraceae bacterium]